MKPISKLNQYFEQQMSIQQKEQFHPQIQAFQLTLLDFQKCPLCRNDYLLTQIHRLPRILIHCGHTLCGECLQRFLIKDKLRCPICLKLIKSLHSIEFLPINHTIYTKLAEKLGSPEDPHKSICTKFTISMGDRIRYQNLPKTDSQTNLNYCCFHPEKIQHFFCIYHETPGCRECMQVRHKRTQCKILDLYELEKQIGGAK